MKQRASFPLILYVLLPAAVLLCLLAMLFCVHPSDEQTKSLTKTDLSESMTLFENDLAGETLQDLAYIPKHYALDESAVSGNVPDPDAYGAGETAEEVEAVIASAAELLDGQSTAWNPELTFYQDGDFSWYSDPTILVLNWTEVNEGAVCYCSEIKIADASQFRRLLVDDTYGASRQLYCSDIAESANAVLASNGDYYIFRGTGVNVYRGTLYRNVVSLDVCMVDRSGDLHLVSRLDTRTDEEWQTYIEENDISFSLAFGPNLVVDGERQKLYAYPVGQIDSPNFRSALGQLGPLHYIIVTTNGTYEHIMSKIMSDKGCINAYGLDGGQTAELYFNHEIYNMMVYGAERTVSDILYFATAYPSPEAEE